MNMNLKPLLLTAAFVSAGLTFGSAQAAVVDDQMPVTITIENACAIDTAPTTLDFGTVGVLNTNVDNTSIISVTCTTGATYDIGLNEGQTGADINSREMVNGSDTVDYQLYSDAAGGLVWGDVASAQTVASTGTGTEQQFTVFGRVEPQATPPAATYTDSVTVTVTY